MNTPSWMTADTAPREWVRRTSRRRAADRRPSLTAILGSGALVAWIWVAYELTRLFVR
jgi:hypothetical protein